MHLPVLEWVLESVLEARGQGRRCHIVCSPSVAGQFSLNVVLDAQTHV